MKKQWNFIRLMTGGGMWIMLAVFLVTAFLLVGSPANAADKKPCYETADYALKACKNAADEVYNLALGRCENIPEGQQKACEKLAQQDKAASNDECTDQLKARNSVCKELGGGAYNPIIDPANFETPDISKQDPKTYFPLKKGVYTYFSYKVDSTGVIDTTAIEKDVVTVFDINQTDNPATRSILNVPCRVVHDVVTDLTVGGKDGQKTEDTTDWYALDKDGNVWYFGEIAQQFKDNALVGIDGSWTAGKDEAKPGYIMRANPKPGMVYRQEFALGEAEDMARVVNNKVTDKEIQDLVKGLPWPPIGITVKGPYLNTQDFSALDPASVLEKGQAENKYYAPGVGLFLVIGPGGSPIEVLDSVGPVK